MKDITEDQLHASVVQYIRLQYPYAIYCHVPNEGKRVKFEQFRQHRLGLVSGVPDLLVFNPNSSINGLALEFKVKKRKATANQIAFMRKLQKCGWSTALIYDIESAKTVIDAHFRDIKRGDYEDND